MILGCFQSFSISEIIYICCDICNNTFRVYINTTLCIDSLSCLDRNFIGPNHHTECSVAVPFSWLTDQCIFQYRGILHVDNFGTVQTKNRSLSRQHVWTLLKSYSRTAKYRVALKFWSIKVNCISCCHKADNQPLCHVRSVNVNVRYLVASLDGQFAEVGLLVAGIGYLHAK